MGREPPSGLHEDIPIKRFSAIRSVWRRTRRLNAPDRPGIWYQVAQRIAFPIARRTSAIRQTTLPSGVRLFVNLDEVMGATIWKTGVYDVGVAEVLWRLLRPGDTAIDAGANIGYMTGVMALCVGPIGMVTSFEPHPIVFQTLEKNAELFERQPGMARIRVIEAALGNQTTIATLINGQDWPRNQGTARISSQSTLGPDAMHVRMLRLDDMIGDETVTLLKIDVEGHEPDVLEGASRLLDTRRITHVVFEDNLSPAGNARHILEQRGYKVYAIDRDERGLRLDPSNGPRITVNEAPSFLATLIPRAVESRLHSPGWQVLRAVSR